MGTMKQWQIERLGYAEDLYAALVILVGDVEALCLTGAALSWRLDTGVRGFWLEEGGEFRLGRSVPRLDGARSDSVELVLTLDRVGDEEEGIGLAYPVRYATRTGSARTVRHALDTDTPQSYTAAQALLYQLTQDLRRLFVGPGRETVAL